MEHLTVLPLVAIYLALGICWTWFAAGTHYMNRTHLAKIAAIALIWPFALMATLALLVVAGVRMLRAAR